MKWKTTLGHFFGFSQKETNGFIILIPIILLIIIGPSVYKSHLTSKKTTDQDDILSKQLSDEIKSFLKPRSDPAKHSRPPGLTLKPALFDPNTASIDDLKKIGLNDKVAQTIENYRNKGGVFRIKKDFLKIYGIDTAMYLALYDFIELPIIYTPQRLTLKSPKYPEKRTRAIKDINLAKQQDFEEVIGIGEILSKRIVAFRSKLGGFHSINQLKEVYGLSNEVVSKLTNQFTVTDSSQVERLNIKILTSQQLSEHPYINYKLANILIAYRDQHGLRSMTDILEIKIMTDSLYHKLRPYLYVSE